MMGNVAAAQFDEAMDEARPEPAREPQVFVRTFTIPAGLPWDQTRAAQLEARHGAPLPIVDLAHRIRRLESWAPGRVGRFAVFYVRRRDFSAPFETTVDVDGAPLRVSFGAGKEQLKHARTIGLAVVIVALAGLLVAAAVTMVLSVRADAAGQLEAVERQAAAKLRLARKHDTSREQSRELSRMQQQGALPADVLADLAWLARSKAVDARIVAVHWDHGLIAVESRGEASPLATTEREVVRAERSVRPGVSLWGVSRAYDSASGGAR